VTHPIYQVTAYKQVKPFVLLVSFNDGSEQEIDFWPVMGGEVLSQLRDPKHFAQVRLDPEVHTLVWPNGADFDPETLRNWPKYVKALAARAEAWDLISV
jgi:hypothetical protein